MLSTKQVVEVFREANPLKGAEITEDRIRGALRRGTIRAPLVVGGRYLWRDVDLRALAIVFGLRLPGAFTGVAQ